MAITDKDRIEFLEKINSEKKYTGKCTLRMSKTGRGWRLHETSSDVIHDPGNKSFATVRDAIDDGIINGMQ